MGDLSAVVSRRWRVVWFLVQSVHVVHAAQNGMLIVVDRRPDSVRDDASARCIQDTNANALADHGCLGLIWALLGG